MGLCASVRRLRSSYEIRLLVQNRNNLVKKNDRE